MKNIRGFTLTELVVVIITLTIITTFILYIIPRYHRGCGGRIIKCGHQLKGLGAAMVMYQYDFNDVNPIVWGEREVNGQFGMGLYNQVGGADITRWANPNFNDWDNQPTVGGCLYLLVKYEDVAPKSFICPKAPNDEISDFEDAVELCRNNGWTIPEDWTELNDFQSMVNLSYSYNDPWAYPTNANTPAYVALLADKSPAYDTEMGVRNPEVGDFPFQNQDGSWTDADGKNPQHGNSNNHQTQTQNVLYTSMDVKRYDNPGAGLNGDNIYTYWVLCVDKNIGRWDQGHATGQEDSYLGN